MANWPPIERLEFPDGGWWEIYSLCTRGMRKAFRRAGLQSFAAGLNGEAGSLDAPDALRQALLAHPDKWDLDAVDDTYLLQGTHAYSYGEAVNLETIDNLSSHIVDQVLTRMRSLYAELPEGARKN